MTPEDQTRLDAIEKKVDAIFASVEKTRRYALATTVITIAVIVLPALALLFAVPRFMTSYGNLDAQMELYEGL